MKLAEEYKSLEESSYAVNWAMLVSEQLGKLESQGEYLESVKNDESFHANARFYALKWLVQNELRGGSVEKALKLAAEIDPGSVFDREISLDLATGLFYFQDDKEKAEEILDNLSRKFTDESTAEVVGLLKAGFVKDVIADNPAVETAKAAEEEPVFSAFPTPFNAETKIRYRLLEDGRVSVVLYNILGQQVLRLVDEKMSAGTHEVIWDGTDGYGMTVPSGMYLCRLETPNRAKTIKLLMTK